jgi:MFS family permease
MAVDGIRRALGVYFRIFQRYPFLLGIAFLSFLSTIALAVIIPTLPLYLKNEVGFHAGIIGFLFSVYATAEIVAKTPFGVLSDRWGKQPVIFLGLLLTSFVPLGFIYARSLVFFVLLEVFNGLGVAAFWPMLSALIAERVEHEERAAALTILNMSYLVALGLGPAFGTYVNHFAGSSVMAFEVAFFLLLAAVVFSLIFFGVESLPGRGLKREQVGTVRTGAGKRFSCLLKGFSGSYWVMLFISLFQQFGLGLLSSTFVLYVNRQLGFDQGDIGTALLIPAVLVATFAIPIGHLADRVGKIRVIQFAYLLGSAVLVVVPFLGKLWELAVAVAFLALAYVAGTPAWFALTSIVVSPQNVGTAFAGISTMQSLGFIIGSPAGGLLYEHLHPASPFFASGSVLFLCLIMVTFFFSQKLPESSSKR